MWTAFRTPAGIAVLNVVEPPHRHGPVVSILLDEEDVDGLLSPMESTSRIEALLRHGRRLPDAMGTPALSDGERRTA